MYDLDAYAYTTKANKIRSRCIEIIDYMLLNRWTLRQAGENLSVRKSTIHLYIHTYIKTYYNDQYLQLLNLLKYNAQTKRRPRKYW